MTTLRVLALLLLAVAVPMSAWAQAAGPVNPSTVTWNGVTTNADNTPIADLSGYQLRVAGPVNVAPAYSPTVYAIKKVVTAASPNPTVSAPVTFGTAASGNLAADLGLTADGQYWLYVSAIDLTMNESGVQAAPLPFVRNRVAPAVPTGGRIDP